MGQPIGTSLWERRDSVLLIANRRTTDDSSQDPFPNPFLLLQQPRPASSPLLSTCACVVVVAVCSSLAVGVLAWRPYEWCGAASKKR
jgi:hypothetical protein